LEITSEPIFWTWVPKISFGPFKFGDSIKNYIDVYNLYEEDTYSELTLGKEKFPEWMRQKIGPENVYLIPKYDFAFSIYTLYSKIIHVCVETYFYYNNQNVLGTSLEKAMQIIGCPSWNKIDSENVLGTTENKYNFDALGLTLWTFNNKVVTVYCDNGEEVPDDYYDYLKD
jgi:hypothetical protein